MNFKVEVTGLQHKFGLRFKKLLQVLTLTIIHAAKKGKLHQIKTITRLSFSSFIE